MTLQKLSDQEQLEECAKARRELLKENIVLRKACQDKDKRIAELEKISAELGAQLQASQHTQDDVKWRQRLDKISYKRVSTPKKKTLSILRDMHNTLPRDENGFFVVRIKAVVNRSDGISYDTARRHIRELAADNIVMRDYEDNEARGDKHRDTLKIKIDPRVLANPSILDRTISIGAKKMEARVVAWGGGREKREQPNISDSLQCPNCGSTRTRGHRHDCGICDDCLRDFDTWKEFPIADESSTEIGASISVEEQQTLNQSHLITNPYAKHPRGISCPDCGQRDAWVPTPTMWGGEDIYICALCFPESMGA